MIFLGDGSVDIEKLRIPAFGKQLPKLRAK